MTLTNKEIQQAINSGDKGQLRTLILNKFEEMQEKGVQVDGFYYAYHVACSEEIFDMFSLKGIESLFTLLGYQVDSKSEDDIVRVVISKDDFVFEMLGCEGMHDSLYAIFVSAATAEIKAC